MTIFCQNILFSMKTKFDTWSSHAFPQRARQGKRPRQVRWRRNSNLSCCIIKWMITVCKKGMSMESTKASRRCLRVFTQPSVDARKQSTRNQTRKCACLRECLCRIQPIRLRRCMGKYTRWILRRCTHVTRDACEWVRCISSAPKMARCALRLRKCLVLPIIVTPSDSRILYSLRESERNKGCLG